MKVLLIEHTVINGSVCMAGDEVEVDDKLGAFLISKSKAKALEDEKSESLETQTEGETEGETEGKDDTEGDPEGETEVETATQDTGETATAGPQARKKALKKTPEA